MLQWAVLHTSLRVWLHLQFSKDHPPPQWRCGGGPWSSTLRASPTMNPAVTPALTSGVTPGTAPGMTPAVTSGAGLWCVSYPLA